MKILSIGDVHGRDTWKEYTHGSIHNFNIWKLSYELGNNPESEEWKEYPFMNVDKIIFIGDYTDSYNKTNEEILFNLSDIIEFKKALRDKVVLLLGNHDIQYIVLNEIYTGYRSEMRFDLNKIFNDNIDSFKIAHLEKSAEGKKWLWTHAGVTSGWYEKSMLRDMKSEKYRFYEITKEFLETEREVDEIINKAFELRMDSLWNVDYYSGGFDVWAGPVWVRPDMLNYWPLKGYSQIIGHTQMSEIIVVDEDKDENKYEDFKHYFIDVPELKNPLILEI